jgi:hypothetical protein
MTETPFTNDVEFLVLEKIQEHAAENGIIVVKESNYALLFTSANNLCEIESVKFVPFAKIEEFNTEMRHRKEGKYIVDTVCQLILDHYGERAKPVVYLKRDDTHWVGMVGDDKQRLHTIDFLTRCLDASYGDEQSR